MNESINQTSTHTKKSQQHGSIQQIHGVCQNLYERAPVIDYHRSLSPTGEF